MNGHCCSRRYVVAVVVSNKLLSSRCNATCAPMTGAAYYRTGTCEHSAHFTSPRGSYVLGRYLYALYKYRERKARTSTGSRRRTRNTSFTYAPTCTKLTHRSRLTPLRRSSFAAEHSARAALLNPTSDKCALPSSPCSANIAR